MSSSTPTVPQYEELLRRTDAPPGSSWHLFGQGDQLGTLNFLTPQSALDGAATVKRGRAFNLDYPLNTFVPSVAGTRPATAHHIFSNNPHHRDDWLDSFYLQSTSQVDGLRHIRHPQYGFYGGVEEADIDVGTRSLGIQLLAEKGIVGRGVLLDAARYFDSISDPLVPGAPRGITPSDLDAMARHFEVGIRSGDILLLHTGWAEHWLESTPEQRAARTGSPGLHQSEEMLAWLWNHQISLAASDNGGLESFPVDARSGWVDPDEPPPPRGPSHNGMMHRPLIALLGLIIGELWKLDELADDCAADGVYEFMLTAKPLNLRGGVGSPPNALAVK
ncbi:cyclase family protein [Streptomyces sp. NBC_00624]|uniref:cyclase family protein n=1 Tax=Streptomyces sp. NBC_00624 TaxID=2975791 RepID=UPI0030DE6E9C